MAYSLMIIVIQNESLHAFLAQINVLSESRKSEAIKDITRDSDQALEYCDSSAIFFLFFW